MSRRTMWPGWLLRGAAILALGGCLPVFCSRGSCRLIAYFVGFGYEWDHFVDPGKKPQFVRRSNRFAPIRSTGNGGEGTIRPNRELWKPFRVDATLGLFDARHATLGAEGEFGFSVMEAGGVGRFYIVTVKESGQGIVVEVGTGGAPLGTLAVPDARAADVRLETTGGIVIFSAKKRGDAAFTQLGAAVATSAGPYTMSVDCDGLPKGTIVGFDDVRITNGAPAAPTATQTARETVYTAIDALFESAYALDGDAPDRTKAGDQLELCIARLDAALALGLGGFPGSAKDVGTARKKAAALVSKVRGTKKVDSLLKSYEGVLVPAGRAANAID